MTQTDGESRVLALFESPGKIETATPGATVWLARDPAAARPVLLKRLADVRARGRATEALALRHPHIVPVRRWLIEDGALYVVRDVVRGKNLRQLLGASRPDPEALRAFFLPVLEALEAAHAAQTAHGGVSLENILAGESQSVLLCDFATADPSDPRHKAAYDGVASAAGDIRAVGRLIAALLPARGNFALPAVRSRIEGVVLRCESLGDLREVLGALERLAAAPAPRPAAKPAAPARGVPRLLCTPIERTEPLVQGGGGAVSLEVRNGGDATLVIRMIATQHAWINVRATALPLTLKPGATARIDFVLSAARLTPGEYRSDIYLSANAVGDAAEDLRAGWFRHTVEVRVTVVPGGGPRLDPPIGRRGGSFR